MHEASSIGETCGLIDDGDRRPTGALRRVQLGLQIAISKAIDRKLAEVDRFQHASVVAKGFRARTPTSLSCALAQRRGQFGQSRRFIDRRQTVQVPLVGGLADFRTTMHGRYALASRQPTFRFLRVAFLRTENLKIARIVDRRSTAAPEPCLSYILIELPATRCRTRIPLGRCFKSLTTCFLN